MATRKPPTDALLESSSVRLLGTEAWPPGAQKGRDGERMEEVDLGYLCKTFGCEGLGKMFFKTYM